MTPEIIERTEFIVVGVRTVLEAGVAAPVEFWQNLVMSRRAELTSPNDSYYAVFSPLPGDARGRYEYVGGVMTDSIENIPIGMVGWILSSGVYAEGEARGLVDIYKTCRTIITDWLPDSGYRRVHSPIFAYTVGEGGPNDPDTIWRVNVPVESPEVLAQLESWFA